MVRENEEEILRKLREKFGQPKKIDERAELEKIFGSFGERPEEKLKEKFKKEDLKPGQLLTIRFHSFNFEGLAVGKYKNYLIATKGLLPNDVAKVKIREKRGEDYYIADLVELLAKSSDRTFSKCENLDKCPICTLQNLSYPAQLKLKKSMLNEFTYGNKNIRELLIKSPISSHSTYNYLLDIDLSVRKIDNQYILALKENLNGKEFAFRNCHILNPSLNKIIKFINEYLAERREPEIKEINLKTDIEGRNILIFIGNSNRDIANALYDFLTSKTNLNLNIGWIENDKLEQLNDLFLTLSVQNHNIYISFKSYYPPNGFLLRETIQKFLQLASPTSNEQVLYLNAHSCLFLQPLLMFAGKVHIQFQNPFELNFIKNTFKKDKIVYYSENLNQLIKKDTILDEHKFSLGIIENYFEDFDKKLWDFISEAQFPKLLIITYKIPDLFKGLQLLVENNYRLRVLQPIDTFPNTHNLLAMVFLTHKFTGTSVIAENLPDLL